MLAEEIKDDSFAIKGCWEVLVSFTGLEVGLGPWMESAAGIFSFHPILIGVHLGVGSSVFAFGVVGATVLVLRLSGGGNGQGMSCRVGIGSTGGWGVDHDVHRSGCYRGTGVGISWAGFEIGAGGLLGLVFVRKEASYATVPWFGVGGGTAGRESNKVDGAGSRGGSGG